jgi:hypothetical protein
LGRERGNSYTLTSSSGTMMKLKLYSKTWWLIFIWFSLDSPLLDHHHMVKDPHWTERKTVKREHLNLKTILHTIGWITLSIVSTF